MTSQSIEMVQMHQAQLRHEAEMARLAQVAAAHTRARRKQQLAAARRRLRFAVTGRGAKPARLAIVDTFTSAPFRGNPAGVCVLPETAPDSWMQAVASELNLPITAFVVPRSDGDRDLRWFTSVVEVDLCGHGTLAATHVLGDAVAFHTRGGLLRCERTGDGMIAMDFPAIDVRLTDVSKLERAAGVVGRAVSASAGGRWWLVEVSTAEEVMGARPDREALLALGGALIVVAAPRPTRGVDSVCRVFAPAEGLDEDPVTGSAHCVIAPWLAQRTGRTEFLGQQLSARGGTVGMVLRDDRVVLRGGAVTVAQGVLELAGTSVPARVADLDRPAFLAGRARG